MFDVAWQMVAEDFQPDLTAVVDPRRLHGLRAGDCPVPQRRLYLAYLCCRPRYSDALLRLDEGKTVFYAAGTLIFNSELKMLLAYPEIHLRVDPAFGDPPLFDRPVVHGGVSGVKSRTASGLFFFHPQPATVSCHFLLLFIMRGTMKKP